MMKKFRLSVVALWLIIFVLQFVACADSDFFDDEEFSAKDFWMVFIFFVIGLIVFFLAVRFSGWKNTLKGILELIRPRGFSEPYSPLHGCSCLIIVAWVGSALIVLFALIAYLVYLLSCN